MSVYTDIRRDAESEEIVLVRIDETATEIDSADANYKGRIALNLGDTLGSDGKYHDLKVREVECCVSGVTKRIMILASAPFDPP